MRLASIVASIELPPSAMKSSLPCGASTPSNSRQCAPITRVRSEDVLGSLITLSCHVLADPRTERLGVRRRKHARVSAGRDLHRHARAPPDPRQLGVRRLAAALGGAKVLQLAVRPRRRRVRMQRLEARAPDAMQAQALLEGRERHRRPRARRPIEHELELLGQREAAQLVGGDRQPVAHELRDRVGIVDERRRQIPRGPASRASRTAGRHGPRARAGGRSRTRASRRTTSRPAGTDRAAGPSGSARGGAPPDPRRCEGSAGRPRAPVPRARTPRARDRWRGPDRDRTPRGHRPRGGRTPARRASPRAASRASPRARGKAPAKRAGSARIRAASPRTVGASSTSLSATDSPRRRSICATTRSPSRESPPSAKKSSSIPMPALRNTSWKQSTRACSSGSRGGADVCAAWLCDDAGDGERGGGRGARRGSPLPLGTAATSSSQ